MTDVELQQILEDETKAVRGDVRWTQNKTMSYVVDFRVRVENESGYVLLIKGSHNRELHRTSFTLFSQDSGRLFSVDAGMDHHNRGCQYVGELHLHRWSEATKDREAMTVNIGAHSEDLSDPMVLWRWFCREAKIRHDGTMSSHERAEQLKLFDN